MASMIFTVTRGGDTSVPVLVDYTTAGTGTNPVAADDHLNGVFPSGRITIAAGATSGTITVASNPDSTVEPDETGLLTISSPTAGVTISPATAIYTFTNDDTAGGSGSTTTYAYGPTDTRDTGVIDAGSTGYRLETTLYDTAWQLDLFGENSSLKPTFRLIPNFNSTATKGYFINADGSATDYALMNNTQTPNTVPGVPFAVEATADGILRLFYNGTQHTISVYSQLEGGKAVRPYGTLTTPLRFIRFQHGGTTNRSVSIKKL